MKKKAKEDAVKAEQLAKEWKAKKAKMDAEWKKKQKEAETAAEKAEKEAQKIEKKVDDTPNYAKKAMDAAWKAKVEAEPLANTTNTSAYHDDFLGDSGPEPGAPISSTPTPAWKTTGKPAKNKDGWLDWMWR